jgi:hypothetical protein
MKLKLARTTNGDDFTEGKLSVDDVQEFYTVEDTDRFLEDGGEKVYGRTAIPRGIYPVVISRSNRFKKDLIEILNVPFFTGIRIHTGNSSKDTDGCIIVGSVNTQDDDDWVGGSRVAYEALHTKVKEALDENEDVTIEIS